MPNMQSNTDGAGLSQAPTREDMLQKLETAESVWLPKDVFETLYLNPERKVAGDLRKKVGDDQNKTCVGSALVRSVYSAVLTKPLVDRLGIRHQRL